MTTLHTGPEIYDVLGIGFGPSNLALAIALHEQSVNAGTAGGLRVGFLERQPRFGWHRGMLIDDATMQVSFLKDLVTMRDPTSDFSFLCYLRDRGKLVDFLNLKTLFPLRIEFHDYFEWAAARVSHLVEYSAEVVSVRPVTRDGEVRYFDVTSRTPGDPERFTVRRTRSICVAAGLEPHLPPGAALSDRVWHTSELLPRVEQAQRSGRPIRRAVVLGAGQSAAEAVDYLHRSFPEAEICSVFAKYGYTPADDSPFANKIFDPEAVDLYYGAPREVKQSLFDYHRSTNYSVVDMDLIDSLSRSMYQEKVQGRERLRMMNVSRLREVEAGTDDVKVTVEFLPTGSARSCPPTSSSTPRATGRGASATTWERSANSACATTRTPCRSAATTGWPPPPRSPRTSTSRAAPNTPTASPRPCCPPPPSAPGRSATPSSPAVRRA